MHLPSHDAPVSHTGLGSRRGHYGLVDVNPHVEELLSPMWRSHEAPRMLPTHAKPHSNSASFVGPVRAAAPASHSKLLPVGVALGVPSLAHLGRCISTAGGPHGLCMSIHSDVEILLSPVHLTYVSALSSCLCQGRGLGITRETLIPKQFHSSQRPQ